MEQQLQLGRGSDGRQGCRLASGRGGRRRTRHTTAAACGVLGRRATGAARVVFRQMNLDTPGAMRGSCPMRSHHTPAHLVQQQGPALGRRRPGGGVAAAAAAATAPPQAAALALQAHPLVLALGALGAGHGARRALGTHTQGLRLRAWGAGAGGSAAPTACCTLLGSAQGSRRAAPRSSASGRAGRLVGLARGRGCQIAVNWLGQRDQWDAGPDWRPSRPSLRPAARQQAETAPGSG